MSIYIKFIVQINKLLFLIKSANNTFFITMSQTHETFNAYIKRDKMGHSVVYEPTTN